MNTKLALTIIALVSCEKSKYLNFRIHDVWFQVFPTRPFPTYPVIGLTGISLREEDPHTAKNLLVDAAINYLTEKLDK